MQGLTGSRFIKPTKGCLHVDHVLGVSESGCVVKVSLISNIWTPNTLNTFSFNSFILEAELARVNFSPDYPSKYRIKRGTDDNRCTIGGRAER